MIQATYVKDGNIGYFKRSFIVIIVIYFVYCFFCASCVFLVSRQSEKELLNISKVQSNKRLKEYIKNRVQEWTKITNKIKEHYEQRKRYYKIRLAIILLINIIIFVLFGYLFEKFNSLYLKRIYPFCIFCVLFGIYRVIYDNISNRHIESCIKTDVDQSGIVEEIILSHVNKQFYYFVVFVISGIIVIIYYLWEIFSKEEYDIVIKPEGLGYKLWINPKVFKTKSVEWSSNYYVEIPREIALLIFDYPDFIKYNNDVKFYVRESDKETLVCKFIDGSVMYAEINLY